MADTTNKTVHVAAAIIVRDGRILACRRDESLAGAGWEFPGGKVEPGEESMAACKREVGEELGVRLSTTWLLDTVEYDYPSFHLTMDCFVSMLVPGEEPTLREHAELRWLARDELVDVAWLPADRALVETIGRLWDHLFASEHL